MIRLSIGSIYRMGADISIQKDVTNMDLAQDIKRDRRIRSRKQPQERTVFTTISCIVKEYRLGEDFLQIMEPSRDMIDGDMVRTLRQKTKKQLDLPPYCMLPEAQYRLTQAIIRRWDGPYLRFAHSPEEILLSRLLCDASPSLSAEDLMRCDFEALLLCEYARRELAKLESQRPGSQGGSYPGHAEAADSSVAAFPNGGTRERIEQLRAFVADIENKEPTRHDTSS